MKITTYIQQIASMFGKSGLLEDLRQARSQYTSMQDVLAKADKTLGTKFKSEEMKRVQQVFSGVVKGQGGKSVFGYLAANMSDVFGTIDALEALVAGEFEERIAAKGMNYRKANLVQLTDAVTFSARYTAKLLTYAFKTEIAAQREEKKLDPIPSTDQVPYEIEWITKGLLPYCTVVAILGRSAADMSERLDSIPDVLADDVNYSNLKNTLGEQKLDPFLFSNSNFSWNPIRRLRMHAVEAKIARSKEIETEIQMTKLQILMLERARAGKDDPAIERELKYLQSLAEDLTRELAELSED